MLTLNLIGAGKVGLSLAYLLYKKKIVNIKNIFDIDLNVAKDGVDYLKNGKAINKLTLLEFADIYIISTPDDQILDVCNSLCQNNKLFVNNIVIHCSGSLSSNILLSAKKMGCYIASIHPAASFNKPIKNLNFYNQIYFTLEGDEYLLNIIKSLLNKLNINYLILDNKDDSKYLYHIANVMVSNFVVGLFAEAEQLLNKTIKQSKLKSRKLLLNLLKTVVNNLESSSTKLSLTGPIARQDLKLVQEHLRVLKKNDLIKIYLTLSESLLNLGTLSNKSKLNFIKLFNSYL